MSFPNREREDCYAPEARILCSRWRCQSSRMQGLSALEGTYSGREQKIDYVPRHIINHDRAGQAAKKVEGMAVTGNPVFQLLIGKRLHVRLVAKAHTATNSEASLVAPSV